MHRDPPSDAQFADCVLISASGEKFYTYKGLLFKRSNVFKDMFENCGNRDAHLWAFELKLSDTFEEIEAATTYIHDTDEFLVKGPMQTAVGHA